MNIIVCVKQVPGTSNVEVDPVTGVLKRDGVESKLNPYDLFALETALSIRETVGGTITTFTMGPPQARASLEETIMMGADRAMLLSDRRFAGSDVHATAYALRCGIMKLQDFDLIICGKQTTDGDTAQVGPEVAEILGIEHAANVLNIRDIDEHAITVTINLDDCLQIQRMDLPCLLTIEKDTCTPRLPSYRRKKQFTEDSIIICSADDLPAKDLARFGLKGSLTQVERIFPPTKNSEKHILSGDTDALSSEMFGILTDRKFI